jgi:hypothetical protein
MGALVTSPRCAHSAAINPVPPAARRPLMGVLVTPPGRTQPAARSLLVSAPRRMRSRLMTPHEGR